MRSNAFEKHLFLNRVVFSFVNSTMRVRSLTFPGPTSIVEFTGEDAEEIDGFPVNSPDCMVQDQNLNKTWKNLVGGLCNTFNKRKPSRQTMDGFMNDTHSSFENIRHEKIQPKLIFGKSH